MQGKTCVITGATSGIGRAAALALARSGARVVLLARDGRRGEQVAREVEQAAGKGAAALLVADLASQREIRRVAVELQQAAPRLDVLLNNAGAIHMERSATVDGLETTFAVNHLASFLLTRLLLARLESSRPARVVVVASAAHRGGHLDFEDLMGERGYSGWRAYAQSKLANVLFTYELARRIGDGGVTANCLHPGVVATGFGRSHNGLFSLAVRLASPFLLSAEKGARTSVHLASSPEVEGVTGRYFEKCRTVPSSPESMDAAVARRLWEVSERLTGLA
jgi:NAD(P)-dependent dehydrogenase (short-subunit alcohol dehydrogenase family)